MKKYLNICNIYILLWCIYYLQGVIYASGSIISQIVLLMLMVISGYCFVITNARYDTPLFIKVLNIFIGVMTIYGILLLYNPTPIYYYGILNEEVGKLTFLKSIYISLLPIYSFYVFTKQRILNTGTIRVISIILIISVTLSYFRAEKEALQTALEVSSMREEFTNNTGYIFLQLIPLLFFWSKRPMVQYILLAYILTFIVMGLKRGAILIGLLCFIWFLYSAFKSASKRQRTILILLTSIIIVFGISYLIDFYNNSEYFQYRVEQTIEGDSSGRNSIYSSFWNHFINQDSFMVLLFGNGAMQTINIAGIEAHNDWLELLICQGLFGVMIYAAYFISLFKCFKEKRDTAIIYNILGMCLLIMFASTLFSMSYNSLYLSITLCLGYCIALTPTRINS